MKKTNLLILLAVVFGFPFLCFAETIAPKADFSTATKSLYQGIFDQAISQFTQVIKKDPSNAGAHHNLACAFCLKGDYDRALMEFEKALKLENSPFRAVIYFNKAVVYFKKKMYKESLHELNRAVLLVPSMAKLDNFSHLREWSAAISKKSAQFDKFTLIYDEQSAELPDTLYFNPNINNQGTGRSFIFEDLNPPPIFFYKSRFAYVFLGVSFFLQEKYPEAEAQFKEALGIKEECGGLDYLAESAAKAYLEKIKIEDQSASELRPNDKQ